MCRNESVTTRGHCEPRSTRRIRISDTPRANRLDRWRRFEIGEVRQRDFKLDSFKWLKEESLDDADELPEPEELASDAIAELVAAVEELNQVLVLLENGSADAGELSNGRKMVTQGAGK